INRELAPTQLQSTMLEGGSAFSSVLFRYARQLVRIPTEDAKPDTQRLPEFNAASRATLKQRLLADDPVYPEMEIAKLTASLQFLQDKLGEDSPIAKKVLNGVDPATRARQLVEGSKLGSAAERK